MSHDLYFLLQSYCLLMLYYVILQVMSHFTNMTNIANSFLLGYIAFLFTIPEDTGFIKHNLKVTQHAA